MMLRFKTPALIVVLGLSASVPAYAGSFCVAVNGGFGNGGTSFIAPKFALPKAGKCKPWAGFTKTATTVVATSTGTGCRSSDGKVATLSILNTDAEFFGPGTAAVDQIQFCPAGVTDCPISGNDQGNFAGPAAQQTCTPTLLDLPATHD